MNFGWWKYKWIKWILSRNRSTNYSFYSDGVKYDDSWNDHFDDHAIEVVNYIFEDDFQLCGYRKL